MEDSQLLLLAPAPVVHILHLQCFGGYVQHPAHGPLLVVEELACRELGLGSVGARFNVQVDALVRGYAGFALGRALQGVEFCDCG